MKLLCDGKRREIRAVAVRTMHPVAHLLLILGMLRKLEVAALLDDFIPPRPDVDSAAKHGLCHGTDAGGRTGG